MKWDHRKQRWTSRTQQRKAEKMALFRKKKEEHLAVKSAFDSLPSETQAKLIETILAITRAVKGALASIPEDHRAPCAQEFGILLRQAMSKVMKGMLTGDVDDIGNALAGLEVPAFFSQAFVAIKLALEEPNGPTRTETDTTTP